VDDNLMDLALRYEAVHTLPAVVPEGEFPRSEVVPVRLARKVGPLFGVRWEHEPFGRTWVCDFATVTLAEIARGAPMPSKEEQARLDAEERPRSGGGATDAWGLVGRAVWTPGKLVAPTTLANATLNRFGPDTKAAVVLTAANRLLEDATSAVTTVCEHLARHGTSRSVALAVWAGLTLEVFRGQPALVVAAIQGRAVQRSLTTRWGSQVALSGLGSTSARCEIGARGVADGIDPWQPVRFSLVDDTLRALLSGSVAEDDAVGSDKRDDIAGAWCRRLLQMGRPGSGLVWLSETDGHRAAHSYQRVNAMVAPFVAEVLDDGAASGEASVLPPWPDETELDGLSTPAVRAHAVAAHVASSYLRYVDRATHEAPAPRRRSRAYIEEAANASVGRLGAEDPAALLLAGYQQYLHLSDVARDSKADADALTEQVQAMLASQHRTSLAFREGSIDPGAASYLLEIGNVALEQARDRLRDTTAVDRALARFWREALNARGMDADPSAQLDDLNDSQIFHLAYYAYYLSTRPSTADLRRSLQILSAVAEIRDRAVAHEPVGLVAKHAAGRDAHLLCANAAARLAERLPERERAGRTAAWSSATGHVRAALANPSLKLLFDSERADRLVWLALDRLEPVLSHLLDSNEALTEFEREQARRLVDAVLVNSERRRLRSEDRSRITALRSLQSRLTSTAPEAVLS
jgi:hypothetical protein